MKTFLSYLAVLFVFLAGGAAGVASQPAATQPATQPTTRSTSPDPAERWEETIQAFEAADAENPPAPGGVLFIGSSSIRGWRSVADDFPELNVINRGFGGSQIHDSNYHADRIVLPYRPKTIVLYAGENDVAGGKSPERVAEDFRRFASIVHEELPETRIFFVSLKPSPSRWHHQPAFTRTNELIRQITESDERLEYVDVVNPMLGEDGKPRPELYIGDKLHMTPAGYELWARILRERLVK